MGLVASCVNLCRSGVGAPPLREVCSCNQLFGSTMASINSVSSSLLLNPWWPRGRKLIIIPLHNSNNITKSIIFQSCNKAVRLLLNYWDKLLLNAWRQLAFNQFDSNPFHRRVLVPLFLSGDQYARKRPASVAICPITTTFFHYLHSSRVGSR